jgi:hypothetical protein
MNSLLHELMSGRVNVTDFNQKLNAMISINLRMMKDDCNMLRIVNAFLLIF